MLTHLARSAFLAFILSLGCGLQTASAAVPHVSIKASGLPQMFYSGWKCMNISSPMKFTIKNTGKTPLSSLVLSFVNDPRKEWWSSSNDGTWDNLESDPSPLQLLPIRRVGFNDNCTARPAPSLFDAAFPQGCKTSSWACQSWKIGTTIIDCSTEPGSTSFSLAPGETKEVDVRWSTGMAIRVTSAQKQTILDGGSTSNIWWKKYFGGGNVQYGYFLHAADDAKIPTLNQISMISATVKKMSAIKAPPTNCKTTSR